MSARIARAGLRRGGGGALGASVIAITVGRGGAVLAVMA